MRSNSATRDEPPTLEELYEFLDSTVDVLETFEPAIGEGGTFFGGWVGGWEW